MDAQPASPPDRTEERRRQIMDAALACFARKGYHNTTMDDIVAESGLSKGTLYWYFKSKDELFASLIKSFFLDMRQDIDGILEQHTTASGRLRAIAQGFVQFFHETEDFFSVFFEFWMQSTLNEELNQLFSNVLVQYKKVIAGIIAEGMRTGEFKAVDASQLALAVMAAYDGLAFYMMLMPDEVDLDKASQVFIETLLDGLAVDEQKGSQ
jgi:TetR/AcrR family transcriptional regulator